jgi:SAM-dependent methyltransferase
VAHPEQQKFLKNLQAKYPDYFRRVRVLDCGSLDINGRNKEYWNTESGYTGIDLAPGKNVNIVMAIEDADWPDEHFHVVISTECFEHNPKWREGLANMIRMLKPGGMLIVTCATTGRGEHGTAEHVPEASPFTAKTGYYKNLTESDIRGAIDPQDFADMKCQVNDTSHDLYFWAIKKGVLVHGCTCDDLDGKNPTQSQWMTLDK